VCSLNRSKKNF